jgi:hypothetical protein
VAEIESLMLANHAEVANGLLYVLGGGWTHHWRPPASAGTPPQPSLLAVAATFLVGPEEPKREHAFTLRIASDRGEEVFNITGSLSLDGRSTDEPFAVRSAFAANANIVFTAEGRYTLAGALNGETQRLVHFAVHDRPPGPMEATPEYAPGGYL